MVCVVITQDAGCSGDEGGRLSLSLSLFLSATCATPLSTIANTATELAHNPLQHKHLAGARRTTYNIHHVHAGNDGSSSSVTYLLEHSAMLCFVFYGFCFYLCSVAHFEPP